MVKGVVGLLELLVDNLAANLLLSGQFGDRLSGQSIEGKLLAYLGRQQPCWGGGSGGRDNGRRAG